MKSKVIELENWCETITKLSDKYSSIQSSSMPVNKLKPSDIFIGYTEDTVPSLINKIYKEDSLNANIDSAKNYLIQCASSDGKKFFIKFQFYKKKWS